MFLIFTFIVNLNEGGNDQMKKSKGCISITGSSSVRTGKNGLVRILRLKLWRERRQLDVKYWLWAVTPHIID